MAVKDWWSIITFKKKIYDLTKEPYPIMFLLITYFIMILLLSILPVIKTIGLTASGFALEVLKIGLYAFLMTVLVALFVYYLLKLFKKTADLKRFLSPYLKINVAISGISIIILFGLAILTLLVLLTAYLAPMLIVSLLTTGSLILLLVEIVLIGFSLITIVWEVKLIRETYKLTWFKSIISLIVSGIVVSSVLGLIKLLLQ